MTTNNQTKTAKTQVGHTRRGALGLAIAAVVAKEASANSTGVTAPHGRLVDPQSVANVLRFASGELILLERSGTPISDALGEQLKATIEVARRTYGRYDAAMAPRKCDLEDRDVRKTFNVHRTLIELVYVALYRDETLIHLAPHLAPQDRRELSDSLRMMLEEGHRALYALESLDA